MVKSGYSIHCSTKKNKIHLCYFNSIIGWNVCKEKNVYIIVNIIRFSKTDVHNRRCGGTLVPIKKPLRNRRPACLREVPGSTDVRVTVAHHAGFLLTVKGVWWLNVGGRSHLPWWKRGDPGDTRNVSPGRVVLLWAARPLFNSWVLSELLEGALFDLANTLTRYFERVGNLGQRLGLGGHDPVLNDIALFFV